MRGSLLVAAGLTLGLLAGCAGTGLGLSTATPLPSATTSPTATASATASPTSTPSPSPTATPRPTASVTASATPSPTEEASPTPRPTARPEPTEAPPPDPASPEQLRAWMEEARAAHPYPESVDTMWAVMLCESSGRADVVAGPYHGLFQYIVETWRGSWNPYRDRPILDPQAQIFATAKAWQDGYQSWWGGCLPR